MNLSDLVKDLALAPDTIPENLEIRDIRTRAQDVQPGDLFLAVRGYAADGHDYIETAQENGAAAVIAEKNPGGLENIVLVADSRRATATVAARFFGHPSRDLTLVGITGTNGKTTTSFLLESIFMTAGFSCGVIGTVNIRYGDKLMDNPITTPDAIVLQRAMAEMKQAGVTHVIMEASSHGLDQFRVDGCEFDCGVYTNLSQDHLDYHDTMDAYFNCKKRLFTDFLGTRGKGGAAPAVINLDDAYGRKLAAELDGPVITVSHSRTADIRARDYTDDIRGLSGRIELGTENLTLCSALTGRFNLENILCAAGACRALGLAPDIIRQGIESCTGVPGRLEKVDTGIGRYLFVDYAHTPDALGSILATLKQRAPKRLITVFGCGGDRDRTKRPLMGQMACKYSDVAVVTSDNPRSEDPEAIVDDIIAGLADITDLTPELTGRDSTELIDVTDLTPQLTGRDSVELPAGARGFIRVTDRRAALKTAVMMSRPGDIIVAAGKGHETYQITNTGTIHFDDREELVAASDAFKSRFTPIPWTRDDLAAALETAPLGQPENHTVFSGVSTDSRTIRQDEVFLALQGESFDGHDFIPNLLAKGIRAFVVRKGATEERITDLPDNVLFFETDDTLAALGKLGRFQRLRAGVNVVAITGSNGKTSTRKMTQEIFRTTFDILATQGNLNNEIGVPLTLLRLSTAHQWAVIEMGMNHPGEMRRLSAMALPDIAVVTNTAGAHLEGLKTADNVARAKAEIFEHVRKNGTAVIFGDDPRRPILEEVAKETPDIRTHLFFGTEETADFRAEDIANRDGVTRFTVNLNGTAARFTLASPARFMVNNALAAVAASATAGISAPDMQAGLAAFAPVSGRMNIVRLATGVSLIDDTYNANPASVTQALNTLAGQGKGKMTIAVLGDMLELGERSDQLHWDIGQTAAGLGIGRLFLFGSQTVHTQAGALAGGMNPDHVVHGSKEEIAGLVPDLAGNDGWILVKGSRGMAMETIIRQWQESETGGKA